MADRTCSADGCENPHYAKGYCNAHYGRMQRHGTLTTLIRERQRPTARTYPPDRFWPKVNKHGPLAANDPTLGRCWEWQGNYGSGPYGLFWSGDRIMNTHKFAYELLVGPVPEGLELDHFGCDNKRCCNPAHLKPVTRRENQRRVVEARTHCKHGHPFDEVNTYWRPDGMGRDCRACRTAALARQDAKRRAAREARSHS